MKHFIMKRPIVRAARNVEAGINLIDKQEHIEQAARALKAISHPLRLKILCLVGQHELMVQEIVEAVGTSQSNISQHLAVMASAGSSPRARRPTRSSTASTTRASSR